MYLPLLNLLVVDLQLHYIPVGLALYHKVCELLLHNPHHNLMHPSHDWNPVCKILILHYYYVLRDEIKSFGKFAFLYPYNID